MRRILLRQGGQLYRLLQFELRDHADGSLNIVFDHKGSKPGSRSVTASDGTRVYTPTQGPIRISYHTSGRVNFHGITTPVIYCQPLFEVTEVQPLGAICSPNLERFEILPVGDQRQTDTIINVPSSHVGEICFTLALAPTNFVGNPSTIEISYEGLFKIVLTSGTFPEAHHVSDLRKTHVVTLVPTEGTLSCQAVSKYQALISFQKLRNGGAQGIIGLWQPETGTYRLIHAVEMRIAPNVKVTFEDDRYTADIDKVASNPAETRFRVKGPAGYMNKQQVRIVGIELSAEL